MAGLPTYTNTSVVKPPGVISIDAGTSFGNLAISARKAAGSFFDIAVAQRADEQKQQVADAPAYAVAHMVTRDANGAPQVQPLDNSDPVNRARNVAAGIRYQSMVDTDARQKAVELRAQSAGDPAAFQAAWQGYTQGVLGQVPDALKIDAADTLDRLGAQHYGAMLVDQMNTDNALAKQAWGEQLDNKANDYYALIQNGGLGSAAADKALANYDAVLQRGVGARFVSPDAVDLKRQAVADQGQMLALAQHAVNTYRTAGGGAKGMQAAHDEAVAAIDDPKYHIDPKRRDALISHVDTQVREQVSIDNQVRLEDARARIAQDRANAASDNATANAFLDRLHPTDPSVEPLTPRDVKDAGFHDPNIKEHFYNALDAEAKGQAIAGAQSTANQVSLAIGTGAVNTDNFFKTVGPLIGKKDGLSFEQARQLRSWANTVEGERDKPTIDAFMKMAYRQVTGHGTDLWSQVLGATLANAQGPEALLGLMGKDTEAAGRYYKLWTRVHGAILDKRKAGEPIQPLFDPKSPEYLGKLLAPGQGYVGSALPEPTPTPTLGTGPSVPFTPGERAPASGALMGYLRGQGAVPHVTDAAGYAKLKKGEHYTGPDGKERVKQ